MRRVSRSAITKAPGSDVCGNADLGHSSSICHGSTAAHRLTCTDFPVNDLCWQLLKLGGLTRAQPGPGGDVASPVQVGVQLAVDRADDGVLPGPAAAGAADVAVDRGV